MPGKYDPYSYKLINDRSSDLKWSDRSQKCKRQIKVKIGFNDDGSAKYKMESKGHTRADIASSKGLKQVSGDPAMINLDEEPCACCVTGHTEKPNHPLDKLTLPSDVIQAPQPKLEEMK